MSIPLISVRLIWSLGKKIDFPNVTIITALERSEDAEQKTIALERSEGAEQKTIALERSEGAE